MGPRLVTGGMSSFSLDTLSDRREPVRSVLLRSETPVWPRVVAAIALFFALLAWLTPITQAFGSAAR